MSDSPRRDICRRIAGLRLEATGSRGKAAFAKQLGLAPSTYDYYERSRVPPAEVLVQIADLAGCDLRWLLTGQAAREGPAAAEHPVVLRAARLLGNDPEAAPALAAFLDILEQARRFPAKAGGVVRRDTVDAEAIGCAGSSREAASAAGRKGSAGAKQVRSVGRPGAERSSWIPVLGRSAAGVPHFWAAGEEEGITTLAELVRRHAANATTSVRPATAAPPDGKGAEATVRLVTLSAPDAHDVTEFIAGGAIRCRYGDAFALRIDGDSMAPEIRHGDLVICSPSVPAADGRVAVVQLRGQIGVTCKLFRRSGRTVHLVPIAEQYHIGTFPAGEVVWALRVLARVRAQP